MAKAPPAAASNPRPPMGAWVGAPGKFGWAITTVIKGSTNTAILVSLANMSCSYFKKVNFWLNALLPTFNCTMYSPEDKFFGSHVTV